MACASELSRINVAALAIGALASELHAFLLLVTVTSNSSFRRTAQKRGTSELKRWASSITRPLFAVKEFDA